MDRNFHNDEFERLLREKSDEFRMYPSKRIWHSIYNNIHPSRKWPSVAMTITLISSLFLVGYLNTKDTNLYSVNDQDNLTNAQSITSQYASQKNTDGRTRFASNLEPLQPQANVTADPSTGDISGIADKRQYNNPTSINVTHTSQVAAVQKKQTSIPASNIILTGNEIENKTADKSSPAGIVVPGDTKDAIADATANTINNTNLAEIKLIPYTPNSGISEINKPVIVNNPTLPVILQSDNSVAVSIAEDVTEKSKLTDKTKSLVSTEDRSWIDSYALYNRPAAKKWANKLAVQMYATPSVVYRVLLNEPETVITQNATPFAISSSSQDINAEVTQTPSYGFEVGTGLQYFLLKGIKLKGGLQLNYTKYNSHAFQNTHPVVTKLTMYDLNMNSLYEVYRATPYSNKSGLEAVRLHNETFQVSLPIGADFRLAGNENLQWNFGVTIQPTYVIGGKSYLISSDRRNYVKESSMLNRWNMNAGFETFITYQANGLTWQIGPQFRSQLFSTNSRKYAVEEKLLNFGLKFGIVKTLK